MCCLPHSFIKQPAIEQLVYKDIALGKEDRGPKTLIKNQQLLFLSVLFVNNTIDIHAL